MPSDYFKSFTQLSEQGLIYKDIADDMARSVGLRNALAHEYDAIDDNQVYNSIDTCLSQVPKYLSIILKRYLK